MSPLEEFVEAKRSGKYGVNTHPITEKNWPSEEPRVEVVIDKTMAPVKVEKEKSNITVASVLMWTPLFNFVLLVFMLSLFFRK